MRAINHEREMQWTHENETEDHLKIDTFNCLTMTYSTFLCIKWWTAFVTFHAIAMRNELFGLWCVRVEEMRMRQVFRLLLIKQRAY